MPFSTSTFPIYLLLPPPILTLQTQPAYALLSPSMLRPHLIPFSSPHIYREQNLKHSGRAPILTRLTGPRYSPNLIGAQLDAIVPRRAVAAAARSISTFASSTNGTASWLVESRAGDEDASSNNKWLGQHPLIIFIFRLLGGGCVLFCCGEKQVRCRLRVLFFLLLLCSLRCVLWWLVFYDFVLFF